MNRIIYVSVLAAFLLLASCSKEEKIEFFKDPENYEVVLFDTTGDPGMTFRMDNGIMEVAGEPMGYILSKETYGDYKLHIEWRWPGEPGNSGVLLHCQGKNPDWFPICIEAQLKNSKAGDFIMLGKDSGISRPDSTFLNVTGTSPSPAARMLEESSENPAGEWNTYEITCNADNIELVVNGVLQNKGTRASFSSGGIAFQSEGAAIEFRNVYLIPLN